MLLKLFCVVDSGLSSAQEPLDNTTADEAKQMAGENYHIQSVLRPLTDFVIGGRTKYACHYFTHTLGTGRFNHLFHNQYNSRAPVLWFYNLISSGT